MTVLNLKPRLIWEGDGNTSTVALTVDGVPLIYRDRSHIRVRQLIVATNAESDMVEGVDYNFGLGTISRIAGNLPSGYKWAIWREQPRAQEVALLTGGDLASSDVEDLGNISVEQIQEMQDAIDRAFKLSVFAETGISNELPAPAASNLIGWNAAANALINVLPADVDIVTLISAFMQSVIQAADAAAARTLLEAMAATSLGDGSISGDATLTGNLTLPGLINLSNTSHALLPGGTTAQRPGTPAAR